MTMFKIANLIDNCQIEDTAKLFARECDRLESFEFEFKKIIAASKQFCGEEITLNISSLDFDFG